MTRTDSSSYSSYLDALTMIGQIPTRLETACANSKAKQQQQLSKIRNDGRNRKQKIEQIRIASSAEYQSAAQTLAKLGSRPPNAVRAASGMTASDSELEELRMTQRQIVKEIKSASLMAESSARARTREAMRREAEAQAQAQLAAEALRKRQELSRKTLADAAAARLREEMRIEDEKRRAEAARVRRRNALLTASGIVALLIILVVIFVLL